MGNIIILFWEINYLGVTRSVEEMMQNHPWLCGDGVSSPEMKQVLAFHTL